MNISDLRKLVSRGEDSRLQYKSDVRNVDALAAEMAAFANCEDGRILIGVSDNDNLSDLSFGRYLTFHLAGFQPFIQTGTSLSNRRND